MKKLLLLSGILSWFNLIVWGFIILSSLYACLVTMNPALLIGIFIISSIILHSYAALKLRKSIYNPAIPLGNQTPTGIRLMGSFVLFLGIFWIGMGTTCLQNINPIIKSMQDTMDSKMLDQYKQVNMRSMLIGIGIFLLVTGLVSVANSVLNFRLLRWYLFMRDNID